MSDHDARNNEKRLLDDAMPARKLLARWVICGTLTLDTAMHLGGESSERVDMLVLRDPREGKPLLPGTTFAGALRNALADRLAGYGEKEPDEVAGLFGSARGARRDDDGSQSPLIVFDAIGELPGEDDPGDGKAVLGIEIRDGVAISPDTGTAEHGKKYDYEVLPAGTTFPVRVDLLVPAKCEGEDQQPWDEKPLLEMLAAALGAFSHSENSFGAKRSRGLGRVSAKWAAKRFDLRSEKGWLEWVLSNHEASIPAGSGQPCVRDVLEAVAPDNVKPLALCGDKRKRVVITLELSVKHDILVRSPGTEPGAPDVSHLTSGDKPILPGTSLAGVMRAQAMRIAGLVHNGKNDAKNWIDRLFGPRFEGTRPQLGFKPRASRLRVGEAALGRSAPQRQTRIAIDRFTQGVVDGALFDEQTEVGGHCVVGLELRDPREGELGLVLLVVKDLLDGVLPVGGASSVGRGVLNGTATVTFHDGAGTTERSASLEPGIAPLGDAASKIKTAIDEFWNAKPLDKATVDDRRARKRGEAP